MPYLQRAFEEILTVIEYPHEDIRKASIEALCQFCINLSKIKTDEGDVLAQRAICTFIPKLSQLIKLDGEQTVAICCVDACTTLLNEIGLPVVLYHGHIDAIATRVSDVFTSIYDPHYLHLTFQTSSSNAISIYSSDLTECQNRDPEDDSLVGEQDILLIESAGILLYTLGRVIAPEIFARHFRNILPLLLKKMVLFSI